MNRFEEHLGELNTSQQQAEYMAQALRYCADQVAAGAQMEALEQENAELKAQNQALNDRLEKAKEYFRESKNTLDTTEERTKSVLSRNLQKTKDELYVLGNALHAYAVALGEKATAKLSLVEVNNLQASVSEIIENLKANGLWNEELDPNPDLALVEKKVKPKAPKKAKKEADEELLTQTSEQPEE